MVEYRLAKAGMRVRFPSFAPIKNKITSKGYNVSCIIEIQFHKLKGVSSNFSRTYSPIFFYKIKTLKSSHNKVVEIVD